MKSSKGYRIATTQDTSSPEAFAQILLKDGQHLLPSVLGLVAQGKQMVDSVIERMGVGLIQSILELSCRDVAGEPCRGKKDPSDQSVYRHGYQDGVVGLSDKKVRVRKPRLRTRGTAQAPSREVPVPAYEAMNSNPGVGERIMASLIHGVSSRDYGKTVRDAADAVGVSKSAVSREFVERSETALKELLERRFDDLDVVVIYIDGMLFREHHVITALGLDATGKKHVLAIKPAGSENSQAVKELLQSVADRGVKPGVNRLFVIDGSKAIRAAIDEVFGSENPVQRCAVHKLRNVQENLPKEKRPYAKMKIKAALLMAPEKGEAMLKEYAKELDVNEPAAAASMREGLHDLFTVGRLGVTGSLARSLTNTNVIESTQSLVGHFKRRVKHWSSADMASRWHATACIDAQKRMRAVRGHKDMNCLIAAQRPHQAQARKAG